MYYALGWTSKKPAAYAASLATMLQSWMWRLLSSACGPERTILPLP
jgi:hypothetical protein